MPDCTECGAPATRRFLCDNHYRKAKRAGTLPARRQPRRKAPVLRRFADNPAPTPQPTPCRITQSALGADGYGIRGDGERMHRWVVRMAGEDQFGTAWDPDLHVLHLCDNPPCFRYDHLWLDTQAANMHDMSAKGRTSNQYIKAARA